MHLLRGMRGRQMSGVELKDETERPMIGASEPDRG
jgi:hypothetical protein